MRQLLKKRNTRYLLLGLPALTCLLAAVIFAVCVTAPIHRSRQSPPDYLCAALPENPYNPEDFTLDENGYMTCLAGEAVLGIDVSGFQGRIDWPAVKNAGVEFVFIRVGGRGYGQEGTLYTDDLAQEYYAGAKAAGLKVGAYFFSQAITPREAQEEAWLTLKQVAGWELDLPVVYDWEWVSDEARTAHVDKTMLTRCSKLFCKLIESAGLQPMIYFNASQGLNMLELEQLSDYPFWLAMYGDAPEFPYRVDYWQYSRTGTVPGISTDVDMNLFFPYKEA